MKQIGSFSILHQRTKGPFFKWQHHSPNSNLCTGTRGEFWKYFCESLRWCVATPFLMEVKHIHPQENEISKTNPHFQGTALQGGTLQWMAVVQINHISLSNKTTCIYRISRVLSTQLNHVLIFKWNMTWWRNNYALDIIMTEVLILSKWWVINIFDCLLPKPVDPKLFGRYTNETFHQQCHVALSHPNQTDRWPFFSNRTNRTQFIQSIHF